jgi:hypothetical protein
MTYTEAHRHFLTALRADPKTPAPTLCMRTIEDLHTWKSEMRAYDAARIELGIVTAQQVQERNAAVRVTPGQYRIIRHADFTQVRTKN